jgi:hypothetical protein
MKMSLVTPTRRYRALWVGACDLSLHCLSYRYPQTYSKYAGGR